MVFCPMCENDFRKIAICRRIQVKYKDFWAPYAIKNLFSLKNSLGGKFAVKYFLKCLFANYSKILRKYRKFLNFEGLEV